MFIFIIKDSCECWQRENGKFGEYFWPPCVDFS